MQDYFVPLSKQAELQKRCDIFKANNFATASWRIIADARGKFIYLRRLTLDGSYQNLGRLIFDGDLENMSFAIYRNRTEKYDSKANFFGAHHLDGTLEGALKSTTGSLSLENVRFQVSGL